MVGMTYQTSPGHPPRAPQHGDALDRLFAAARGIGVVRGTEDKWFGGVCAGLARRWNVDPLIVRALFLLATVLFGIGVPAYFAAWTLLPDEAGEIVVEKAVRQGHVSSIVLCVVAAVASFGGFGVFWSIGSGWGVFGQAAGLAFLAWAFLAWNGHGPGARRPEETTQEWGDRLGDRMRGSAPTTDRPAAAAPDRPDPPQSVGNRAAAAGAAAREGGIDLAKDGPYRTPGGYPYGPFGPAAPAVPVRVKRRRFGAALTFAILGISVLAGAFTALVLAGTSRGDSALQVGLAAGAAAAALALVIGGLAGRRGGVLGPLATLAVLGALLLSVAAPKGMPWTGAIGDESWRPTAVTAGDQHNFTMRVGDGELDLSGLSTTDLPQRTALHARVNVGRLTITVPRDVTVHVHGHAHLGEIEVLDGDTRISGHGGFDTRRIVSVGSGPKVIDLSAEVGVGDLTIKEK